MAIRIIINKILSTIKVLSPLSQFEVTSLLGFNSQLFGVLNFSLTNFGLYILITLGTILAIHYYGDNEFNLVPNK